MNSPHTKGGGVPYPAARLVRLPLEERQALAAERRQGRRIVRNDQGVPVVVAQTVPPGISEPVANPQPPRHRRGGFLLGAAIAYAVWLVSSVTGLGLLWGVFPVVLIGLALVSPPHRGAR